MSIYVTYNDSVRLVYFEPVSELASIKPMHESEGFDAIVYEYSYSFDNTTWSEWFDSDSELLTHFNTNPAPKINIYTRIRLTTQKDMKTTMYAVFDLKCVDINGENATVSCMEFGTKTDILRTTNTKNLYQPYRNLGGAIRLEQKMAKSVSDIFGFECTYFRTEPDTDTKNVTFKTYSLSKVVEFKPLRICINNNELPDNRFDFSEFDIDFIDEIEIHIVIEEFENVFGKVEPNANDYLFLPLTGRMYQINTIYDQKNFMNKATYYRGTLVTWTDRANVDDTIAKEELTNFVDYTDEFEFDAIKEETQNAVRTDQSEVDIDSMILLTAEKLVLNQFTVFEYMYDLSEKKNDEVPISYKTNQKDDEFAITSWFKVDKDIKEEFNDRDGIVTNHQILALYDDNKEPFFQLSVNKGKLTVNYTTKSKEQNFIEALGSKDIEIETLYCVVANYVFNEKGQFVTLSVVDSDGNTIQEYMEDVFTKLKKSETLGIFGRQYVANTRFRKSIVMKSDMLQSITDPMPSYADVTIADTATPALRNGIDCYGKHGKEMISISQLRDENRGL